jgi:hypothetical protein
VGCTSLCKCTQCKNVQVERIPNKEKRLKMEDREEVELGPQKRPEPEGIPQRRVRGRTEKESLTNKGISVYYKLEKKIRYKGWLKNKKI